MHSLFLASTCAAVFASAALAQTSTACLPIGTNGALGCQSTSAPTLSNGVVATGSIDFIYDNVTALLTVRVTNTSPIVAGQPNPVITAIGFNFPLGAVSGATLVSQSAQGGANPSFMLQFTPNANLIQGCFGCFNAVLSVPGPAGGIGNAQATVFASPIVVLGRTSFDLQLSGPGVGTLTASAIAAALSGGGTYNVATSFFFQGGGVGGAASGYVSNGTPCCLNAAALQPIGTGCAPTGLTIPTLTSIGTPFVGGPVGVDALSPSTPNSIGLIICGFSTLFDPIFNVPLPIDLGAFGFPGCSLHASNEFVRGVTTNGAGLATLPSVVIPSLAKWCGREITYQAFFLTGSNGVLSSAGLTAILGS